MIRPRPSPVTTIALGLLAAASVGHALHNRNQDREVQRLRERVEFLDLMLGAVLRDRLEEAQP